MDDRELIAELKQITQRLTEIEIRLAEYNAHLDYHILRTDEIQETSESMEKALESIKAHVYKVQGAAAFIALCGVLAGIWRAFS